MKAIELAAIGGVNVAVSAEDVTHTSTTSLAGGRPFVLVPATVSRVFVDSFPDDLPCVARWRDAGDSELKRFELPAAGGSADSETDDYISETLRVAWTPREHGNLGCEVKLTHQLPRLPRSFSAHDQSSEAQPGAELPDSQTSTWRTASEIVEELIDSHVDLINHLCETSPSSMPLTGRWQGRAGSVSVRGVADVAAQWHRVAQSDEPRMALIVRLASELPQLISQLCRHPRSVLRRERQLQSLGRVTEIDSGGLRWLARQPGATVAEKAGAGQRVLAITRVESVDTLENRVVRDLLTRGIQACQRYLREHRAATAHARMELVAKFGRLLTRLLRDSAIGSVASLVGVPQPNYVLQMEPRYRILWKAYQQLVHQQQLEDNVWRWRQRLFAEHVQLGIVAALNELADPSRSHGGDVLLQREQNAGQFLDGRTALGPWRLKQTPDVLVDLVRIDQLQQHEMIPERLAALGADFVLVKRTHSDKLSLVGCWSVLDFDLGPVTHEDRLLSLDDALATLPVGYLQRCLLFQPLLAAHEDSDASFRVEKLERCRSIRMTLPLQQRFHDLVEQLRWALDLS
jgi:hypothetical protein